MSVNINDVRTELQIPDQVLDDDSIASILVKVGNTDLNLVCAECLRFVLRKYRGRVSYRIGNFSERIDSADLRRQVQVYMRRSSATVTEATIAKDTEEYPLRITNVI